MTMLPADCAAVTAVVHRDLDGLRAELEFEQATAKRA